MTPSEFIFTAFLILALLLYLHRLYEVYEPRIATILLSGNHKKVYLEYWKPYAWYDSKGRRLWSKRPCHKYLFTL